ncbi:DNA translocase FtsK [Sedimentibacter sp. zth1]|uniref:FtsK/SpoIIIE family DNA translocase n=1 Tax=Sedimentibacter sp. zth1 TaxID=2816908 RepID=UPI001A928328|nr:DNA translocase FtsK [Sedimentibacter sp. zth1]QSX06520.1 DNA translocase FtsK [Sedimentibacter sp. zth1]
MNNKKEKKTKPRNNSKSTTNRKKKISSKEKKQKEQILKKEIIGVILIAIASFLMFAVNQISQIGIIGDWIKIILHALFGRGMYILPFAIMFMGIIQLLNVIMYSEKKQIIAILGLFLCILILVSLGDVVNNNFFTQQDSIINIIKVSNNYNIDKVMGGGIFGNVFCFVFVKLVGITGTYILSSAFILIFTIIFTNKSMIGFFKMIINFIKKIGALIYNFVYVEVDNTDVNISEKGNKKPIKETEKQSNKNIEIFDYNSDHNQTKALQKNITQLKIDDLKEFSDDNQNNSKKSSKDKKIYFNKTKTVSVNVGPDSEIELLHSNEDENLFESEKQKSKEKENVENVKAKDSSIDLDANKLESIEYVLPDITLLNNPKKKTVNVKDDLRREAEKLLDTLHSFKIECNITQISKGPTITRYELQPAPGIKVSRITSLSNDLALSLATSDIRIEAPIPGKSAVGIEVPNKEKTNVIFKSLVESKEFKCEQTKVPFALGKDIAGKNIIGNIEKMPHLLVAGATGSGKSVCINTLIMSILYKAKPDEVKLILIDPKVVELSIYNGIPHLLIPVVTDPRKASNALNWAVSEMTTRYKIFASNSVRDIFSFNTKIMMENRENEKMPQIVIIIDELADLMQVAPGEVEESITRIAQLARACGIHLVIATQRPSVDVITGTIKANIPSRIAFAVSSYIDSRTILDASGAEKLLGKGDMLYHPIGIPKPIRIQGTFITDDEIKRVVDFVSKQRIQQKINNISKEIEKEPVQNEKVDDLLEKAIELVVSEGQASASYLQRRFSIGYNRAARLIDALEKRGIVSGREGSKPRKVLVTIEELEEMKE